MEQVEDYFPMCRCLGRPRIKLPVWGPRHSVAVSLQRRAVVSRGLLDSYRQQKGMVSEQGSHQASGQKLQRHPRTVTPTRGPRDDDDDELCSPECVREIFTGDISALSLTRQRSMLDRYLLTPFLLPFAVEEFEQTMQNENPNTLIVVDFYKTACGSCRYIQPGFVKLCHSSEEEHAPVVFLKHNVIDE